MASDALEQAIVRNREFAEWVGTCVDSLSVSSEPRAQLAGAALSVSLSHHVAIAGLVKYSQTASACALLRPQIDAYLRALWIAFIIPDEHLRQVCRGRGRRPPDGMAIMKILEDKGHFEPNTLYTIGRKTWHVLCDFTHCGPQTLFRHLGYDSIGPNFSADEIVEMLAASNAWASMAAIALAEIADRKDLVLLVLERAKSTECQS